MIIINYFKNRSHFGSRETTTFLFVCYNLFVSVNMTLTYSKIKEDLSSSYDFNSIENIEKFRLLMSDTTLKNRYNNYIINLNLKCKLNYTLIDNIYNIYYNDNVLKVDVSNFTKIILIDTILNKNNIYVNMYYNINSDLSNNLSKLGKIGYFFHCLSINLLNMFGIYIQGGFIRDTLGNYLKKDDNNYDLDIFITEITNISILLFKFYNYNKKYYNLLTLYCKILLNCIYKNNYLIESIKYNCYRILHSDCLLNSCSIIMVIIIEGTKIILKLDINPIDKKLNNCDFFANTLIYIRDVNSYVIKYKECSNKYLYLDYVKNNVYNNKLIEDVTNIIYEYLYYNEIIIGLILKQIINKEMEYCHINCSDNELTEYEIELITIHIERMKKFYDRGLNIIFKECKKKYCACQILKSMYKFSISKLGYICNLREHIKYCNIKSIKVDNNIKEKHIFFENQKKYVSKNPLYLRSFREYSQTYYDKQLKSKQIEKKKKLEKHKKLEKQNKLEKQIKQDQKNSKQKQNLISNLNYEIKYY